MIYEEIRLHRIIHMVKKKLSNNTMDTSKNYKSQLAAKKMRSISTLKFLQSLAAVVSTRQVVQDL